MHCITHAHGPAQKCIEAIGANAFKKSPYPVVITLENHTDEVNQRQMATDLRQILGSKLYIPSEEDRKGLWRSPEYLKGKVSAFFRCALELDAPRV